MGLPVWGCFRVIARQSVGCGLPTHIFVLWLRPTGKQRATQRFPGEGQPTAAPV
jgi:hypothetical protein